MSLSISSIIKRRDIQKRAVIIAIIVGTILNCINQAPEVMDGEPLQWTKALLTYLVPYSVSLYSSVAIIRKL